MKTSLEPLVCTSTILNQSARQSEKNWFVIGYIPNLEHTSSAKRRVSKLKQKNRSLSVRDYHMCLRVLLEPLKDLQSQNPVMKFRRGDQVAHYRIIAPVATVLGDNLSSNKLCGKMDNKTSPVRMSRMCFTGFEDSDQVPHCCNHVPDIFIERLCMSALGCCYGQPLQAQASEYVLGEAPQERANSIHPSPNIDLWRGFLRSKPDGRRGETARKWLLSWRRERERIADIILRKVFGSHSVDNAFNGVDFGSNQYGRIARATVADILHSVEEGLINYVLHLLFNTMTDSMKRDIDEFVEAMFCESGRNRSGERPNYPRIDFTRGFCSLSFLSADQRVGQLFVVAIMLHIPKGKELLQPRFEHDYDTKAAPPAPKRQRTGSKHGNNNAEEEEGEEEEEEEQEEEEEEEAVEEGEARVQQITLVLEKLQLGYVTSEIVPLLPQSHRDIFWKECMMHIRNTGRVKKLLQSPEAELFPFGAAGGCLDYRNVTQNGQTQATNTHPCHSQNHPAERNATVEVDPDRAECSIRLGMEQFSSLVERLLCFHAFLKYGGGMLAQDVHLQEYMKSLNTMLEMIVKGLDRGPKTNGFKIQKFIECCHFSQDTLMYGPPAGNNSDTGERGLKTWAKKLAVTAQKRGDSIFKEQVANNSVDKAILDRINDYVHFSKSLQGCSTVDDQQDSGTFTARCRTFVYRKGPKIVTGITPVHPNSGAKSSYCPFPVCVENWFDENVVSEEASILLCTEVCIPGQDDDDDNQTLIRAHPNFRAEGAWFDYISIMYEDPATGIQHEFPARVACFFRWAGDSLGATSGFHDGDWACLVQESEYQTAEETSNTSLLFDNWRLRGQTSQDGSRRHAQLSCLPIETIERRVFAIDPEPMNGGAFWKEIKDEDSGIFRIVVIKGRRDEWVEGFLS